MWWQGLLREFQPIANLHNTIQGTVTRCNKTGRSRPTSLKFEKENLSVRRSISEYSPRFALLHHAATSAASAASAGVSVGASFSPISASISAFRASRSSWLTTCYRECFKTTTAPSPSVSEHRDSWGPKNSQWNWIMSLLLVHSHLVATTQADPPENKGSHGSQR